MLSSRNVELQSTALATALGFLTLGASAPAGLVQIDSQVVVNRYLAALDQVAQPQFVVFSYRVSQAGDHNVEQTHRIFRGDVKERDETVSVDGSPSKIVRVVSARDRYAVEKLAPRTSAYVFLFLETRRTGKHLDYVYSTEPLSASAFTVTEVTVDGETYLPTLIRFKSVAGTVHATGYVAYARFSRYWMPTLATASAVVSGLPTRERIAWSAYSFPTSLPPSTFRQPNALALPTVAPSALQP